MPHGTQGSYQTSYYSGSKCHTGIQGSYHTSLYMPHRDTSIAIKQAITPALNATQGHKCSYQTSYYLGSKCHTGHKVAIKQAITQALNATQGHKSSYQTRYYSGSQCHTGTHVLLSNKLLLRL